MSQLTSKHERALAKEERTLKQEAVHQVRQEKAADEAAQRRLAELYRTTRATFSEAALRKGWKCTSCGFMNFEPRLACSKCVATAPHAICERVQKVVDQKLPGTSSDPSVRLITVSQRCYRTLLHTAPVIGRTAVAAAAPYATYDGDHFAGGVPRKVDDASDDDDDEPNCRFRMEGAIDDDEDELVQKGEDIVRAIVEDDEDEGAPGATIVQFNSATNTFYAHVPLSAQPPPEVNAQVRQIAKTFSLQITCSREPGAGQHFVLRISGPEESNVRRAETFVTNTVRDLRRGVPRTPPPPSAVPSTQQKTGSSSKSESATPGSYTHFVSLPLGTIPTVHKQVLRLLDHIRHVCHLPLKDEAALLEAPLLPNFALSGSGSSGATAEQQHYGVDESVLQTPVKFHFTILMLRLPTAEDVDKAKALTGSIQQAIKECFAPGTTLHLAGLKSMQHKANDTNVLYVELNGDADDSAAAGYRAFSALIRRTHRIFLEAGLTTELDTNMGQKIHATIVNTKWRRSGRDGRQQRGDRWQRSAPIDATRILEQLGAVSLGRHVPSTVEISRLIGPPAASGYYAAEAVVPFDAQA